jgi:hypothetical protein
MNSIAQITVKHTSKPTPASFAMPKQWQHTFRTSTRVNEGSGYAEKIPRI